VEIFVGNRQIQEKLPCWHVYASICTWRIPLNDAYIHQSAPCAFERMIHICVNQHWRC